MPDGGTVQTDFTYRTATRKKSAPLIMIAGPPGVGKTYSALSLATGLADGGKIYLADTDNGRAEFYADDFAFEHLNLHEPFRPMIFKEAAERAQRDGAAVFIIDNFMAEHTGPGGLLEWHTEEQIRMSKGDAGKMESVNALAWAKVKPAHKAMRERLYQLNMPVILCCGAEKKIAMVKQTEGKDRGKTIPVDQGLVPICGADIPWAMTISLMLGDVARPGVPTPIKALLPALVPIIPLDRPLSVETGRAIGAWSRGEKPAPNVGGTEAGSQSREETPPASKQTTAEPRKPPQQQRQQQQGPSPTEEQIEEGARDIGGKFLNTEDRRAHLALVDDPALRKQIDWLRKNRREYYDRHVDGAIKASWQRTDTSKQPQTKQTDTLI